MERVGSTDKIICGKAFDPLQEVDVFKKIPVGVAKDNQPGFVRRFSIGDAEVIHAQCV